MSGTIRTKHGWLSLVACVAILVGCMSSGCTAGSGTGPQLGNVTFTAYEVSNGMDQPYQNAEAILDAAVGTNWSRHYQIDGTYSYPSIPFNHTLIRIKSQNPPMFRPTFSLLFTEDRGYLLTAPQFNAFLTAYGAPIAIQNTLAAQRIVTTYLDIYGAAGEHLFGPADLIAWTAEARERYHEDPDRFLMATMETRNGVHEYHAFTVMMISQTQELPSTQDLVLSEYTFTIGSKGEMTMHKENEYVFHEFVHRGSR